MVCTNALTHARTHTFALFIVRVLFRKVHVCGADNAGVCDLRGEVVYE